MKGNRAKIRRNCGKIRAKIGRKCGENAAEMRRKCGKFAANLRLRRHILRCGDTFHPPHISPATYIEPHIFRPPHMPNPTYAADHIFRIPHIGFLDMPNITYFVSLILRRIAALQFGISAAVQFNYLAN
jgi:hypothetical protein